MPEAKLEAFILFNEHESAVQPIADALVSAGVSTYFWRRDIKAGQRWEEVEDQRLREADAVVVFLGSQGWGPNHLRLLSEARKMEKRVVPVLVGLPPEGALEEADGFFRKHHYIEMREPDPSSIQRLVEAIREREPSRSEQVEGLLGKLVDGNEEERAEVLQQIKTARGLDRRVMARRLREEIAFSFAPSTEDEFTTSPRPPKLVSSIRSWMLSALIWAEPESEESRALILSHVNPNIEPDRSVRFWTLAGLYQAKASYVEEALKIGARDEAPEVAELARVAAAPADSSIVDELRKRIHTVDFDTAWPALRVLRIIPVPELAAEVCEQMNTNPARSPFSYDALYALSHPEMARAAAPLLENSPGIAPVVERVIDVSGGSNSNAARNFAVLLNALDAKGVDRELEAALSVPRTREVARRLRRHLTDLRSTGEATAPFLAGYTPDTINVADDRLDIREDVQTLTAVMLAKGVTPPLAIGLFGDWGSGKSFFMRSMKAAAEDLAGRAAGSTSSAFCSNIVSIEFNAWHYVDTNLWASLVSYILEQLEAYVSPKKSDEETRSVLVNELSSARAILAEAQGEKARAERLIAERQEILQELKHEREQKEVELRELRLHDLRELLGDADRQALEKSLEEIGLPAALNSVSDLSRVVSEGYTLRGRANALFAALLNGKNRGMLWLLMALVLVVIPLAAYLLRQYAGDFVAAAGALVSQFIAVTISLTAVLRQAVGRMKTGLGVLEGARQKAERVLAEKRRNPSQDEIDLQKEIARLSAQEEEAASRLAVAAARVQELEERIRSISEGKSLARFLAERASSEDYRKHLGLISTVRRDFELLSARLSADQGGVGDAGLRRVDRIILYIDDLDRCPVSKVMDVLQAVHLLLAYPLFVVVVGVDPRWLLHSLGKTYSAFEGDGQHLNADPDIWRTTPQNYLEKIFQIPFTLRPMSASGYSRLIDKLFSVEVASDVQETKHTVTVGDDGQEAPAGEQNAVRTVPESARPSDKLTPRGVVQPHSALGAGSSAVPSSPASADFIVNEESLIIKPWEAAFADRLFALIPTPRAAKRFSNTYRILKAAVRRERLLQFEGTAEVPGDFQVPMLLLSILIGAPAEAAALFPALVQRAAGGKDVSEALLNFKLLDLSTNPLIALEEKIKHIVNDEAFPNNAEEFLAWLPRVSRFSFETGRAVALQR